MHQLFQLSKKTFSIAVFFMVTTLCAISCEDKKEDVQPQPTISSLNISEGEVGTKVTITGTNFGTVAADIGVTFNNTNAVVSTVTATQVTTSVPAGATSGTVKVKVKSLEATGPSFTVLAPVTVSVSPFSVTINENPINGGLLGTISATTNRGNLTYTLKTQSVAGAMAINSTTGILTVATVAAFDFEVNPTITGVVSVANGNETATANITITLTNVIDVALDNFSATVAENLANGTVIGTMNLTKGPGTFAITSQTPAGALAINATSGQLTVANSAAFDFEVNPTISATVSLTGGSEVKTASVSITLTNVVEAAITSLSTNASEALTSIVIKGENFGTVLSAVKVLFNAIENSIEVNPTAVTNTEITVTIPSNARSGPVKVKMSGVESNGMNLKILPTNGLIGKYLFNGDASDAQSSNIGTVGGASLVADRFSNENSAYSFDGINDNINLGDLPAYRFGTGDFTISLWFQFTDSQRSAILSKRVPTGNFEQYSIIVASDGNANSAGTKAGFFVNTSNFNTRTNAFGPYNDNLWHNLVLVTTYAGTTKMYIDNVLKTEGGTAFTGTISAVGHPLMIGAMSNNTLYFKGKIDDVRIYNRALASDEF